MLVTVSGLQVISEITFSLDLWVVHSATAEDFFHFQVFSSHFQVFSVINYVLFTYKGHQRRSDFPRVTASKPALPDVPCSSIFTKGREPLLGSFSTHSPLQDFMALVFPHWQAIRFSSHLPVPDFLYYQLQFAEVAFFHQSGSWESFFGEFWSTDPKGEKKKKKI